MRDGRSPESVSLVQETARVSGQHDRINELYGDLHRALARGVHHHTLVCFARLRDVLHAHFEVEDRIYFPTVRRFRPERTELVKRLEAEHVQFRALLEEIDAFVLADDVDAIRERLALLVGRLLRHENDEQELLDEIASARGPAS